MPDPFGSFQWICNHTVLPQCNLIFSQLYRAESPPLTTLFPDESEFFTEFNIVSDPSAAPTCRFGNPHIDAVTGPPLQSARSSREDPIVQAARSVAGTGVGANCETPRVGQRGSPGDIALIVLSALSLLMAIILSVTASRRKAAVGRIELRFLLFLYGIHCVFQILTMSSLFEQGGLGLSVMSSIHVAFVATLFWVLLGNGLIATQFVEDGTAAALAPLILFAILFFIPTLYIGLDTSFGWTSVFRFDTDSPDELKNITLFVLTLIWPAAAAFLYTIIMLYITLVVLKETKPALLYFGAFALFAGAQVVFFLASQPLCDTSNGKVNSAFLATLLESASVGVLFLAWKSITEDDWGEEVYGIY
ncbi:hypothetical protein I317_02894 [Kwoniella heveanensis CBS 569]|nr:hypothetical protein I317_02894 [Kwoniella heveanensis CBS 569]